MSGSGVQSMGLDVALGVIVLLWAIRGWFKGFVRQAIGLGALVGSFYLANPVRDLARPHLSAYLPSLRADVLDRLLWWTATVVCFVVITGLSSWVLRWRKPRTPYTPAEPNRADQGAGFLLGAAKGAIVVSFLASAFLQYIPRDAEPGNLVENQRQTSRALALSQEYQPAQLLWNSYPIQALVGHIRRNGFWEDPVDAIAHAAPAAGSTVEAPHDDSSRSNEPRSAPDESVRTARRTPSLSVPTPRRLDPRSPTFLDEVDDELRKLGLKPGISR